MRHLRIISAPSVLGLKPGGVAHLGESLLKSGLAHGLQTANLVIYLPVPNEEYSYERDKNTGCLNPTLIRDFSVVLMDAITPECNRDNFLLVLGGDCSILLGIMPALKKTGETGLVFLDAHADFYAPSQSPTGEIADMDLAIVTGRGPEILTNIGGLKPYVEDRNVIHIGQRDAEETKKYGSQDIAETEITRFDLRTIEAKGIAKITEEIVQHISKAEPKRFWLHFDTDVLDDGENPAVDYRLPGGLKLHDIEVIIGHLLATNKVTGMSITIFNPWLDQTGEIATTLASWINKLLHDYLKVR